MNNKQQAYAELRTKIDAINEALEDARSFAEENDLVMTHKHNHKDDYYDLDGLLTVKTVEDKAVKNWDDSAAVEDAEGYVDYCWLPSSMRC
jgi:hypothetical protein